MEEQEIGIDFENLFDFYTGLFSLSNYPLWYKYDPGW